MGAEEACVPGPLEDVLRCGGVVWGLGLAAPQRPLTELRASAGASGSRRLWPLQPLPASTWLQGIVDYQKLPISGCEAVGSAGRFLLRLIYVCLSVWPSLYVAPRVLLFLSYH